MPENKYELPATPVPQGETGTPLTRRESREIVTPYAFEVARTCLVCLLHTRCGVALQWRLTASLSLVLPRPVCC